MADQRQPTQTTINRRSFAGWIRLSIELIIGLYGLSLTVYLALRILIGENWLIIALANTVSHLFMAPALILLVVCLLARRWILAGLMLPASLILILSFGPPLLNWRQPPSPIEGDLRILTFNIGIGTRYLDPISSIIRDSNADVVAMQEFGEHAAARFASEFAEEYPYQAFHFGEQNDSSGMAVMSRFPLLSDEFWETERGQQRVTFNIGETPVVLYNVHLSQPLTDRGRGVTYRRDQANDILQRLALETGAIILAGDFNMTNQSTQYERFAARLTDTFIEAGQGLGFTYPAAGMRVKWRIRLPMPISRIDYVFHNGHFQGQTAYVGDSSGGSDHHPLIVQLALRTR
jgi:vancomycin resistance protein VanJ